MSELFKDKFRSETVRLSNWNYSGEAAYFITICTLGKEDYFGKVEYGKMIQNELGKIVETEWLKSPVIRPDMNLKLGKFIVMPNHFHGIIIVGENQYNNNKQYVGSISRDAMHRVPTDGNDDCSGENENQNRFGPQTKNLASIIRGFKSSVTTYARKNNIEFGWQPRYYEHIIRNSKSFNNITYYIINNPRKWESDSMNIR